MKRGCDKKGLSQVVSALLIILLVIVLIVIVWGVVRNVLEKQGEGVFLEKVTINLDITKAKRINDTNINVTIKREIGRGEIYGVYFVVYDKNSSEVMKYPVSMKELQEKNFEISLYVLNASRAEKIAVAPIFQIDSGKEIIGEIKDEYIIGKGGSSGIINPGCTQDSECTDTNLCTVDRCSNGVCLHTPMICNDNNLCTNDLCSSGTCTSTPIICSLAHATSVCSNGNCVISSCNSGWGNCDGVTSNGCETNLLTNISNCGSCGSVCSLAHATSACSNGNCGILLCATGWRDCNSLTLDGCETNILTNISNCGSCGNNCLFQHVNPVCTNGVCSSSSCATGWGNCDGVTSNGCETNLLTNISNCGSCGSVCSLAHATSACSNGNCGIVLCASGWGNCDGVTSNGCETPLNSVSNCGSCGNTCSLAHATSSCSSGSCVVSSCNSGWGNCNGLTLDGCETNILTNISNCGSCGNTCSTGYNCVSGACDGSPSVDKEFTLDYSSPDKKMNLVYCVQEEGQPHQWATIPFIQQFHKDVTGEKGYERIWLRRWVSSAGYMDNIPLMDDCITWNFTKIQKLIQITLDKNTVPHVSFGNSPWCFVNDKTTRNANVSTVNPVLPDNLSLMADYSATVVKWAYDACNSGVLKNCGNFSEWHWEIGNEPFTIALSGKYAEWFAPTYTKIKKVVPQATVGIGHLGDLNAFRGILSNLSLLSIRPDFIAPHIYDNGHVTDEAFVDYNELIPFDEWMDYPVIYAHNRIQTVSQKAGTGYISASTNYNVLLDDQWNLWTYTLGYTNQGTLFRTYVNGELIHDQIISDRTWRPNNQLFIVGRGLRNASIDNLGVINRSLSPSEIESMYNSKQIPYSLDLLLGINFNSGAVDTSSYNRQIVIGANTVLRGGGLDGQCAESNTNYGTMITVPSLENNQFPQSNVTVFGWVKTNFSRADDSNFIFGVYSTTQNSTFIRGYESNAYLSNYIYYGTKGRYYVYPNDFISGVREIFPNLPVYNFEYGISAAYVNKTGKYQYVKYTQTQECSAWWASAAYWQMKTDLSGECWYHGTDMDMPSMGLWNYLGTVKPSYYTRNEWTYFFKQGDNLYYATPEENAVEIVANDRGIALINKHGESIKVKVNINGKPGQSSRFYELEPYEVRIDLY